MVRLRLYQKLVFLIPVLLGAVAGMTGSYLLAAVAVLSLFVLLGFMSAVKGYRSVYQFFFSFLICLPINMRVSIDYFKWLKYGDDGVAMATGAASIVFFVLTSIELIVLGIVSYLIWGERDDALSAEKEKDAEKEFERRYRTKREKAILAMLRQQANDKYRDDESGETD